MSDISEMMMMMMMVMMMIMMMMVMMVYITGNDDNDNYDDGDDYYDGGGCDDNYNDVCLLSSTWSRSSLQRKHSSKDVGKDLSRTARLGMIMTLMVAVTQRIPTSHIPTKWESVLMMKGGNMEQSISHHTYV